MVDPYHTSTNGYTTGTGDYVFNISAATSASTFLVSNIYEPLRYWLEGKAYITYKLYLKAYNKLYSQLKTLEMSECKGHFNVHNAYYNKQKHTIKPIIIHLMNSQRTSLSRRQIAKNKRKIQLHKQ